MSTRGRRSDSDASNASSHSDDSSDVEHDDTETWQEAKQRRAITAKNREKQNALLLKRNEGTTDKRLRYLSKLTDGFFLGGPLASDSSKSTSKAASTSSTSSSSTSSPSTTQSPSKRKRMTESAEDAELLKAQKISTGPTRLTTQPECVKNGIMKDYQLRGLNWLIGLYDNGINGILADEMGLGKTMQTISLLGYLKTVRDVPGPHIIIVPKSTQLNWMKEIRRWCPVLRPIMLDGNKKDRAELIDKELKPGAFDILVCSYQIAMIEKSAINKFAWQYIVIDEAHRIKNEQSSLSKVVRMFSTQNRLLITGTPLQNNLHELWALLNFLLPDVFSDDEQFDDWFQLEGKDVDAQNQVVSKLHRILSPFLLRRLKKEVQSNLPPKIETKLYVGLSESQRKLYVDILSKDMSALNGAKGTTKSLLQNICMHLRKVCNHPYLFDGVEPGPPFEDGPHLIHASGKLSILHRLLAKLQSKGSRVLIFSQMTRMLDILEDYCVMEGHTFCRIDGTTDGDEREAQIEQFNAPGSGIFVFLLSTRAGGLGINLATADTVVLYDSDWNPQMDLQAQDRAHRIGQTRPVSIYRFICEDTIEEKIIERADMKLRLDAIVVQQGRLAESDRSLGKDDMVDMIRFGADRVFKSSKSTISDEDIDSILERGKQKTAELQAKYDEMSEGAIKAFSMDSTFDMYEFQGKSFRDGTGGSGPQKEAASNWIAPPERTSKSKAGTYSVSAYYRDTLATNSARDKKKSSGERLPKPRAPELLREWQFPGERLIALHAKEMELYKRQRAMWSKLKQMRRQRRAGMQVEDDTAGKKTAPKKKKNASAADDEDKDEGDDDEDDDDDDENDDDDESEDATKKPSDEEKQLLETYQELLSQEALSEREQTEKERLVKKILFPEWTKGDMHAFATACGEHGRENLQAICKDLGEVHTAREIKEYHSTFFTRGEQELSVWPTLLRRIEEGEARLERHAEADEYLEWKVKETNTDTTMYLAYAPNKSLFTPEEDDFLVRMLHKHGFDAWEAIKLEIQRDWRFRFNWYLKSRSELDLETHAESLMRGLKREFQEDMADQKQSEAKRQRV